MKFYFSPTCYWDNEKKCIIRDNEEVKITPSQKKLLEPLIKYNGKFVPHEQLYRAMAPDSGLYEGYKASLANQFTRIKKGEEGILVKVPEIKRYYDHSRSLGYKISVPKEKIMDETVPAPKSNFYSEAWFSRDYFSREEKNQDYIWQDDSSVRKKMRTYLMGERCSWPILLSSNENHPVRREVIDTVKEKIEQGHSAIAITGAGGEGKTTILMQLCLELYHEGRTVFYHQSTYKYDFPEGTSECVLFVDHPSSDWRFKDFLSKVIIMGATVIIAARSNEWNIIKESLSVDVQRSILEIEIPRLSINEAEAFASCVKRNVPQTKRSISELKALFFRDSFGFLYASMLMAIYNRDSLEDIARQILDEISEHDRTRPYIKIVSAIVFAEQCNVAITTRQFKSLCRSFSLDDRDARYYLRMEIVQNGANYQTRHNVISRLFYRYLFTEGNWKNSIDSDTQETVITTTINYFLDELSQMTRDLMPTNPKILCIISLCQKAFKVICDEDTILYLIQRLFESCRQHGHAAIDQVYHLVDDPYIKAMIAEKCYNSSLPLWEVYKLWIKEIIVGEENDIVTASEYLKNICTNLGAPLPLWQLWARVEEKIGNMGDYSLECTASWIYKTISEKFSENEQAWISWARFAKRYNSTSTNLIDFSPSHILKEGCINHNCSIHAWLEWASIEEDSANIGDYNTPFCAAWIYKECCERTISMGSSHGEPWVKWSRFAERHPQIEDSNETYSPFMILKRACTEHNAGADAWSIWATVSSTDGNVGGYSTPDTTLWILREACMKCHPENPNLWIKWASLAEKYPRIFEKNGVKILLNSAAILKMACIKYHIEDPQVWAKWAQAEEKAGNTGDYNQVGSAAWIFKEGCTRSPDEDHTIWLWWARFIQKHPNLSEDEPDTPTYIFKNHCLAGNDHKIIWTCWAIVEEAYGNIGDYNTPYSAAWIHKETCAKHTSAFSALEWAKFAYKHPMRDSTGTIITAKYILDDAYLNYPAFRNPSWVALNDFKNEIGYTER